MEMINLCAIATYMTRSRGEMRRWLGVPENSATIFESLEAIFPRY